MTIATATKNHTFLLIVFPSHANDYRMALGVLSARAYRSSVFRQPKNGNDSRVVVGPFPRLRFPIYLSTGTQVEQNLRAQIEEELREKVREMRSQCCRGECHVDDLAKAFRQFADFVIYEILPPNRSRSASPGGLRNIRDRDGG